MTMPDNDQSISRRYNRRACRSAVALMAALWLYAFSAPATAHEVLHEVALVQAMSIHLTYSDGEPFSYESYELYADSSKNPAQTGRTDAQGRVVFIPGGTQLWRLRAFSQDGHGVDLKFPGVSGDGPVAAVVGQPASNRTNRLILGLSIILALFGALQFFLRRKKSP